MRWCVDARRKQGGFWRCLVKYREWDRARYDRDPFYRIRQIDRSRRNKALVRRRERRLRREHG